MLQQEKQSFSSTTKIIRYIYVLLATVVVFTLLIFTIIQQQSQFHANQNLKAHNFYLVGINFTNRIQYSLNQARLALLQHTISHKDKTHSPAEHKLKNSKITSSLSAELRDHNSHIQELHKEFNDTDFSPLVKKLDLVLNSNNIDFDAINITTHQLERLYERKLDIITTTQSGLVNTLNQKQIIPIVFFILLATIISTLVIKAIKGVGNRLQTYQLQLEDLVFERTRELHEAQDELLRKERLATLGNLTATVSHELRNPLGAIRPSLYVLRKKITNPDDKLLKAMDRIDRNVQRCDHIIDELLDFTRIKNLELSDIKLNQWLTDLISEQAITNDIMVKWNLHSSEIILNADPNRLRRAVINAVENACHAMLEEYEIDKFIPGSQLTISTSENDSNICITISDNGCGMSQDVLNKIYVPLFSTKGFGVGLGLPALQQIIKQHNGTVDIISSEGEGTCVTLMLPLQQAEELV